MLAEPYRNSKGEIISERSDYNPSAEVVELTKMVKQAYADGRAIQDHPYAELNYKSLLERENLDKQSWLGWNPEPYSGEEEWRFSGIRPFTRAKIISTAAHLTANLIVPKVFAQNQFQTEDRAAASVMADLIEYNIKRSNYDTAFLFGVISGLVSPINFFKVDYTRGWQEIWNEDKRQQVVDDVLSGFQSSLVSSEDMLFSNAYVFEWQKQDWIIEKGMISYGNAQAEFGQHENFVHVSPGKSVILAEDGSFYDVEDINDDLVEKVVYKCRTKDIEIPFIGGVYMGGNNTEYNPFSHRTPKNKPRYNTVKYGYEPIDAMRFVAYKSLVAKLENDQEAIDREWQDYFDASRISTYPPVITMGAGKMDKSVLGPAIVTNLDAEAKVEMLDIARPNNSLQALREALSSGNETSIDPQGAGISSGPQKTAQEAAILQQNQDTNLSIAFKMVSKMVEQVGELFVDDIIHYQTIGEMGEITGEMSYKTFLLDGKVQSGRTKTSYIKFTDRWSGIDMSKEEKDMEEYKMLEEAGDDKIIYEVNPFVFRNIEFFTMVYADKLPFMNEYSIRSEKLATYDRAILNPLIAKDLEAMSKITRDFLLEPLMGGNANNYMPNIEKVAASLIPSPEGGGEVSSAAKTVPASRARTGAARY